jgi:aspartyl-tRNA(Asn)/glutamyl-tRNA(Gln) amidotransferase subunit A
MLSPASSLTPETCEAATRRCLAAIAEPAGEGARIFTQVYERAALEEARAADTRRRNGSRRSGIDGCVVAVKDLFDVRGQVTWAGSRALQNTAAAGTDAAAVARLRDGGGIIIGKTNMTEFAYSGVGLNPHFGTPANPYGRSDAPRIPGGSSSGAAVAVSDGMADIGLGTDTGGSVRIPAALCGLVGWKPTARRIGLEGVWPLAHTFDSVGVIARRVQICIAADEVLTTEKLAADSAPPNRLRLGRLRGYVESELDVPVARAYERAIDRLEQAGAQLIDLEVPELERVVREQPGVTMTTYEAFQAHASLLAKFGDLYDPRVRTRLELGRPITAEQYAAAAGVRRELQVAASKAFRTVDACLYPTVRIIAPPFSAFEADTDYLTLNRALLRNTALINLLDGCALTLPCHDAGQAPVGLSIAGPGLADARVLLVSRTLEPIIATALRTSSPDAPHNR